MFRRCGRTAFFFFNDTATTEIYTLSLHDALPIYIVAHGVEFGNVQRFEIVVRRFDFRALDRKSTRLNSSHSQISYAVFCLKKKTDAPAAPTNKYCEAPSLASPPRASRTCATTPAV